MSSQQTSQTAILSALLLALACGGDEPAPKPAKAEKDPAAAKPATGAAKKPASGAVAKKKKEKKKKRVALETYPRIDDKYRRVFSDGDFVPDSLGDERRDPFQSFIVRQGRGRQLDANVAMAHSIGGLATNNWITILESR